MSQTPPIPLSLLFHLGRNALPQDLSRLDWNLTLLMLEDETYACGGSRILLASNMVCPHLGNDWKANDSHLMITYPTTSNALESFVLDRAEESTHSAMLVSTLESWRDVADKVDILVHAICIEGFDTYTNYQPWSFPHLPTNPLAMPRNNLWRYSRTLLLALPKYRSIICLRIKSQENPTTKSLEGECSCCSCVNRNGCHDSFSWYEWVGGSSGRMGCKAGKEAFG
jgi:hypothetical protein